MILAVCFRLLLSHPPEDKAGSADQAKRGPPVLRLQRTPHHEDRQRDENQERHANLEDLQLRQRQFGVTSAVGRNVNCLFKKSDSPTDEGSDVPRFVRQRLQMQVPGHQHTRVRDGQEQDCTGKNGHSGKS